MIGTLTNQKGGVGKTTNTIHLGSALAEKGYKVLLIDMDSQCNLSQGLGVNCNDEDYNIINLLEKKGNIQLKSKANNLFLIRGSINFNSKK
ncbi:AAA family ATPase, partial [Tenacibaculum finnmarkense genomovar finnmarkense]